jgi:hypothetical protein
MNGTVNISIVKILKSPIYEGRLADFAAVFADHRKELEFSLVVHTTVGVDAANQTLANLTKSMQAVTEKLDMIAVFRAVLASNLSLLAMRFTDYFIT